MPINRGTDVIRDNEVSRSGYHDVVLLGRSTSMAALWRFATQREHQLQSEGKASFTLSQGFSTWGSRPLRCRHDISWAVVVRESLHAMFQFLHYNIYRYLTIWLVSYDLCEFSHQFPSKRAWLPARPRRGAYSAHRTHRSAAHKYVKGGGGRDVDVGILIGVIWVIGWKIRKSLKTPARQSALPSHCVARMQQNCQQWWFGLFQSISAATIVANVLRKREVIKC